MVCGSGGSKSRLAKAAGAEPSGQMRDEKLHAVVARSTFRSQNAQNTSCSDHFWKLWWRKSARRCGAKHIFKVKKNDGFWAPLDVQMSFRVAGARARAPCQKVSKTWGFSAFRVAGAVKETCSSEMLGGQAADFLKNCILEHQICSFGKMILCDKCSALYDLASLFCGRQSTLDRWSRKTARRIGRRPSALHSTFHFWGMSRRNAAFLMLSTWKDEEVSQNSFVFKLADR